MPNVLCVSDLSNIEGRVLAWLAGEQWKLDAFAAYDRGEGEDLYKLSYHRAFGTPLEDIGKEERQVGKVQELALGYEGGPNAYASMAANYGLDLSRLYERIWPQLTQEEQARCRQRLRFAELNNLLTLPPQAFLACEAIKHKWRAAHPRIAALWREARSAFVSAADSNDEREEYPIGDRVRVRSVRFCDLWKTVQIRLPSKGILHYHDARAVQSVTKVVDPKSKKQIERIGLDLRFKGELRTRTAYQPWASVRTHGGKLIENITQAVARDVMAHNMPAIDREFPIIGTSHDEVITESESRDVGRLSELLSRQPPWADGLPLSASGFVAKRYRKD